MKKKPAKQSVAVMAPVNERVEVIPNSDPPSLLMMAVQQNMDLTKIEKLIELQERWKAGIAREQFNEAMAKFQKIAPNLTKNKKADFQHKTGPGRTTYQYQTLDSIAHEIRGPLSECGLSYSWGQKEEGNKVSVWCILRHVGGHEQIGNELSGEADVSGGKAGIQAKASTITYLRRYTLTGLLGLSSADRDDDGAAGSEHGKDEFQLPPLPAERFAGAMKGVISGAVKIEDIQKKFTLTEEQLKSLEIATKK